jgi:hypothetical protein
MCMYVCIHVCMCCVTSCPPSLVCFACSFYGITCRSACVEPERSAHYILLRTFVVYMRNACMNNTVPVFASMCDSTECPARVKDWGAAPGVGGGYTWLSALLAMMGSV